MMNFLLGSDKNNVEKHEHLGACPFCKKQFSNPRALRGHLRVHQRTRSRKSEKYPVHSVSSEDGTKTNRNLLLRDQREASYGDAGKNLSTSKGKGISGPGFLGSFSSNDNYFVNAGNISVNNIGNSKTESILSPICSYAGNSSVGIHHCNTLSSDAFAPAGVSMPIGFSVGPPMYMGTSVFSSVPPSFAGSNGVWEYNTGGSQSSSDAIHGPCNDAIPNVPDQNLSNLPYSAFAIPGPHPDLGTSHFPVLNEPTTFSSYPLGHNQSLGQYKVHSEKYPHGSIISESCKKRTAVEIQGNLVMENALKRSIISSNPHAPGERKKAQKKELPLFNNVQDFFAVEIGTDIMEEDAKKEERETEIDLSLHL
ncbi:TFIIH C1-like domain containing protein [Quillaja saponaria]|uniref:TFIIH C1-like domain containing protein n=1 Tax=Quillaja saponaria TaxID=32244 RepID=A0AAD7PV24_QUISA|nr:TFIIH C1-like domain containing protein [Quillaja saponaria]